MYYQVKFKDLATNKTVLEFITGGTAKMTIEDKVLAYQNRIALLESRVKKDNGRIVAKLKRKLRALKNEDHWT